MKRGNHLLAQPLRPVPDAGPDDTHLRAWGIDTAYIDAARRLRRPPAETVRAVATALGARAGHPPASPPHRFVRQGRPYRLERPHDLLTEDGAELAAVTRLPRDLPAGYHRLRDGATGTISELIVAPLRCPLPPAPQMWGWATQLYATRSRRSWGIGDLGDLAELGAWASHLGAGMLLVNPLHAPLPTLPQQTSPYYPSSRRYRNPLYIRIEAVPGVSADAGVAVEELARAGRALNARPLVDRDEVFRLKMTALELLWSGRREWDGFDAYLAAEGEDLAAYATFCVLCEQRGARWHEWPAGLRHPSGPGVAAVARANAGRVRFHAWIQWLLDEQLRAAARTLPAMHDLAVGVDPCGADAWLYQDVMAPGFTVGAPPDFLNALGQDWNVPPFDPWKLRAASYRPFVAMLRAALRHGGGLRIDHVMGLFRLFWIPHGGGPDTGTYVRYPYAELLDLLALESSRAGALIAGEDLGTVEPLVRRQLAARNILTYRVAWFERRRPGRYPPNALAAATTHDLPTIAGAWTGTDFAEVAALGTSPSPAAHAGIRRRIRRLSGLPDDAPVEDVIAGVYTALGQAPSAMLCAALEDLLCVTRRPNVPGTTDSERANWSIALPATVEEFWDSPLAAPIARALGRGGA
jgi:4-alpha-glucanotransferase